ncbi:serine/threonine-protein kinase [Streptomyces sp. NPDC004788]
MRDQLLGGRYRLVRQLGAGGMGQVWEARDESLDRLVAVKVISLLAGGGSHGDEARARFLREARITARLQHPGIVTIHDLGETDDGAERAPFLVMELVRGEGLDAILRRGPVALPDAAHWGAQICDALADAHRAGVMHRDIKPSNVFVAPSGTVKLLDFGIARAADPYATADRLTQTGFIIGTPPYMAPEQARGFPEPRSDLYALGCVLFELITGRLPFQAPDTVGYLSAHLTQDPPAPGSVAPGIPAAWDDLVLTLLRKDPAQRYPDAAALARALRRLGADARTAGPEPVPPQPAESRAELLARLAAAMRAVHDAAAARTPVVRVAAARTPAARAAASRTPVVPATKPLRPAAPSGPSAPPKAADRTLARFLVPAPLVVVLLMAFQPLSGMGPLTYCALQAVTLALAAALTPRSGGAVRAAGYAAAALDTTGTLVLLLVPESRFTSSGTPLWPYVLMSAAAVATYCYRETGTRRARQAGRALTGP